MRLKSVYISEYKNLKDFSFTFGEKLIDVFIGKNGTGKSNFFEALIEIFRHLYEYNKYQINFDYKIKYEIDNKEFSIDFIDDILKINNRERKTIRKTLIPDNILMYYSGQNKIILKLISDYEINFKMKIKNANLKDSRKFIGINDEYKQLLLAIVLLLDEKNNTRKFIIEKLGIKSIGNELKIVFKRPFYAEKKGYDVERLDETANKFWKPVGINKEFLEKLLNVKVSIAYSVREEGYFERDKMYSDEYILYLDLNDFQNKFCSIKIQELFRAFDNLKLIGMLSEISIKVILHDDTEIDINHFSDGQLQTLYIYSVIEIFKSQNCLILFDEPDSYLHPEWQVDFLKHLDNMMSNLNCKNHILISSHSAITLIPYKYKVEFFDIKDKRVNYCKIPTRVAIEKLGSKLFKYSEQEQILSIINSIQIENKPVLFTEGSSDPIIIKEAWYKLYEDDMPFIPFYAFGCNYLSKLLIDTKVIKEMNGKPVFGIFDFDVAYNYWKGIQGNNIVSDPNKGLIKYCSENNVYVIMLPIPDNKKIRGLVIKNEHTKETYCGNSCCEIEHLFYGSDVTKDYFKEEPSVGGGIKIIFKSDSCKTKFAKEIIPNVEKKYFEVFKPMFEFIRSKC